MSVDAARLNPEDRQDIEELSRRITAYRSGLEDDERFRHFRLTRGVYGQRQHGVQMFRIKMPFGKLTTQQLETIADLSDRYASSNLHLTTRQNIQLHYVKLENAPAVWEGLAAAGVTARESCGNTVRNLTASPFAGIDPEEPFDVTPYVYAAFRYFLRNPVCQEMGRKIKPAFSSSERDTAHTYFHDFGYIPRIQIIDGKEVRGFKVVVGGGLGAVPYSAETAYEFLPEDQIIPFMEAGLRVFDRFGEREKRMKARMKFLLQQIGLEEFLRLVQEEWKALKEKTVSIDRDAVPVAAPAPFQFPSDNAVADPEAYRIWERTNVLPQKQTGYVAVQVRVPLGNLSSDQARSFAVLVRQWAADDIRVSINQGLVLRFVRPEALPSLYNGLLELGLGQPGFDSTADVTACPGTDTCALGVTNSTALTEQLETLIREEYPDLLFEQYLKIKISGCMNSCGQHMAAQIGLHGSSIKRNALVIPAMQVVLGGGVDPEGRGFMAEKVIKLPSKRIPAAVRLVLDNYQENAGPGEYFNYYVQRQDKRYFYDLLKPLANLETITPEELQDWGQNAEYEQLIGVGECAGVQLDMVSTILSDAVEKVKQGAKRLEQGLWADAIYLNYQAFIIGAKALLLTQDIKCNTHIGIIEDFDRHFVQQGLIAIQATDFAEQVLQLNQNEPEGEFARRYAGEAAAFVTYIQVWRRHQLADADALVIANYYQA